MNCLSKMIRMTEEISKRRFAFLCKYLASIFIFNFAVYAAATIFFTAAETFSAAVLVEYSFVSSLLFTTAACACLINIYSRYYRNYLYRIISFFAAPLILASKMLVAAYDTPFLSIVISSCAASLILSGFYFYKLRQFSGYPS